jgi:hypothetical protein
VLDQVEVTDVPKDFISQLIQEDKTFHVGSLIKEFGRVKYSVHLICQAVSR